MKYFVYNYHDLYEWGFDYTQLKRQKLDGLFGGD